MSTQSDFFRDQFKKLVAWELQEVLESSPCEFLSFFKAFRCPNNSRFAQNFVTL